MYEKVNPYDLINQSEKNREIRQDGYSGKNKWNVFCDGKAATIFARDAAAAMWTAGKIWGLNMKRIGYMDIRCKRA